jgi:hypothetical protein
MSKFDGACLSQMLMPMPGLCLVEAVDIGSTAGSSGLGVRTTPPLYVFSLQSAKERFSHSIVPAIGLLTPVLYETCLRSAIG